LQAANKAVSTNQTKPLDIFIGIYFKGLINVDNGVRALLWLSTNSPRTAKMRGADLKNPILTIKTRGDDNGFYAG
jgi:hypothetical protein